MKQQSKHPALTWFSAAILFVFLFSNMFVGLPTSALAQASDPESTPGIPALIVDESTLTPEEVEQTADLTPTPADAAPVEPPTATPEGIPTEETPVEPEETPVEPIETLEPEPLITLEPTPVGTLELTPTETTEPELDPSLLFWSLVMDLPVPNDQIQEMGGTTQTGIRLLSSLDNRVTEEDVEVDMLSTTPVSGGTSYRLEMEGSSLPQDFRHLLFAQLGSDFDLLGGPVELSASGAVTAGQSITFTLESRPATGYSWAITGYDAAVVAIENRHETESKSNTPGAPAWETITARAIADGETTLRLAYQRSFDAGETPTRRLSLQSVQIPQELDLSSPLPPLSAPPPVLPGPDETLQALQTEPMVAALPSSFDWRSQGKVPAVRDQGTCGSCWAFGTAGAMESALMIQKNVNIDISEQYLISCNNNGWGCGGGWWAHDLHTNTSGKNNNPPGAVLESDLPYANRNGTCSAVYNHPQRLVDWRYVSGINVPSVDAIKAAIYNYGPVAASVCSIGFNNYSGGVYTTNNTSCSGGVDHAIILVGWNDSEQSWILRNSWGSRWGENGYMRIRWGVSNVGYGATYVIAKNETVSAPKNDDFNNAVSTANPGGKIIFKETINISGATRAGDDPSFPFSSGAIKGEKTVWYRFTTVNSGQMIVNTAGSNYDTVMGVWTGNRGSLTRVKWNDNASSTVKTSKISFPAKANTTYYINVVSKRGESGSLTFRLQFTPPKAPNNSVSYPVKIPYTTSGANYAELRDIWNATTVSTDPKFPLSTGSTSGFRTVWYTIRPTASGVLTVNTKGSNFDTILGVFKNTTRYAWDDNSGGNGTSALSIRLAGQVTYRIMVASKTKSRESRQQLNVIFKPDSPVSAGTYDNSNNAVALVNTWDHIQLVGAFGNTVHQTTQSQSIANLTFTGTGINFIYTSQPGGGNVNIFIDGKRITSLSQKTASVQLQRKWSSPTLKRGTHNITIISTNNGKTNVDSFVVRP